MLCCSSPLPLSPCSSSSPSVQVLGFRPEAGQGDLSLRNLWMLETTHRLAVFTRTWNKSMSRWLRRLAFQRCPAQPLLATFAFSAWWHGLRPGQVFGFLCWAVMVEADYCIHPFLSAWATSQGVKLFYHGTTSVFTQLIVAYIAVAVETESFSMLCLLWTSCNGILPLSMALRCCCCLPRSQGRTEPALGYLMRLVGHVPSHVSMQGEKCY